MNLRDGWINGERSTNQEPFSCGLRQEKTEKGAVPAGISGYLCESNCISLYQMELRDARRCLATLVPPWSSRGGLQVWRTISIVNYNAPVAKLDLKARPTKGRFFLEMARLEKK